MGLQKEFTEKKVSYRFRCETRKLCNKLKSVVHAGINQYALLPCVWFWIGTERSTVAIIIFPCLFRYVSSTARAALDFSRCCWARSLPEQLSPPEQFAFLADFRFAIAPLRTGVFLTILRRPSPKRVRTVFARSWAGKMVERSRKQTDAPRVARKISPFERNATTTAVPGRTTASNPTETELSISVRDFFGWEFAWVLGPGTAGPNSLLVASIDTHARASRICQKDEKILSGRKQQRKECVYGLNIIIIYRV